MSKITIETVENGWVVLPDASIMIRESAEKARQVARTPKELCGLIEEWTDGAGKQFSKREKST